MALRSLGPKRLSMVDVVYYIQPGGESEWGYYNLVVLGNFVAPQENKMPCLSIPQPRACSLTSHRLVSIKQENLMDSRSTSESCCT